MNVVKKALIGLLIINLMVSGASASFFDWIYPKATQQKEISFQDFYDKTVAPLNTNNNIELIGVYLKSYGVTSIRVRVIDYKQDFYVGQGIGATLLVPAVVDGTFYLSSGQVKQIAEMLKDGKLSYFEKLGISLILNKGIK